MGDTKVEALPFPVIGNRANIGYSEKKAKFVPMYSMSVSRARDTAKELATYLQANESTVYEKADEHMLRKCAARFLGRAITNFADEIAYYSDKVGKKLDLPFMVDIKLEGPKLEFVENLVTIDRFVTARLLKGKQASEKKVMESFQLDASRKKLRKLLDEPTKHAAEKKCDDFVFENRDAAALSGAKFPRDLEFVHKHHLAKQAGTFNETMRVNPETGRYQVKWEGEYVDVTAVRDKCETRLEDRLFYNDKWVLYRENLGLVEPDNSDPYRADPEKFKTMPIVRKKENRKHKDYRIELFTIKSPDGAHNHMSGVLKNPDGEIRDIGFFRKRGEEKDFFDLLEVTTGDFSAADRYKYMRMEKYTKKTVVRMTKEQHDAVIADIEHRQANPNTGRNYSPIHYNCVSLFTQILREKADLDIPTKASLLHSFFGINLNKFKIFRYFTPLRLAAVLITCVLSFLRNLVTIIVGAVFRGPVHKRLFKSPFDFLKLRQSMPDHTHVVIRWQEKVEKAQQKAIEELKASAKTAEEKATLDERIHDIKVTIPEHLRHKPQRSLWWYIKDAFWAQSDEDDTVLTLA